MRSKTSFMSASPVFGSRSAPPPSWLVRIGGWLVMRDLLKVWPWSLSPPASAAGSTGVGHITSPSGRTEVR